MQADIKALMKTPEGRELLAARKQARKQARRAASEQKIAGIKPRYCQMWEVWRQDYPTEAIALAELIRYINRFIKRYPQSKRDRSWTQQRLVEMGYSVKDRWIEDNRASITEASISKHVRNTYTDWAALEELRWITGRRWQNKHDFTYQVAFTLFAYTFDIEGVTYRFHSRKEISVDGLEAKLDPATNGRAMSIRDEEIGPSLLDAIRMAAIKTGFAYRDLAFWEWSPGRSEIKPPAFVEPISPPVKLIPTVSAFTQGDRVVLVHADHPYEGQVCTVVDAVNSLFVHVAFLDGYESITSDHRLKRVGVDE